MWHDEKERVLKYQAQLQLSYVETLQKNQALELRVGQLGGQQQHPTSSCSSSPCPSPGSTPPTHATAVALMPPTPVTILHPPPLLPLLLLPSYPPMSSLVPYLSE